MFWSKARPKRQINSTRANRLCLVVAVGSGPSGLKKQLIAQQSTVQIGASSDDLLHWLLQLFLQNYSLKQKKTMEVHIKSYCPTCCT